jgi:hypothetical protein
MNQILTCWSVRIRNLHRPIRKTPKRRRQLLDGRKGKSKDSLLRRRRERRGQCSSNARAPDPQLVALPRSTLNLHSNPLRRRLHWHSQRNPRAKVKNSDNRRSLRRKSVLCRASRLRKHVVRSPAPSYQHLETQSHLLNFSQSRINSNPKTSLGRNWTNLTCNECSSREANSRVKKSSKRNHRI